MPESMTVRANSPSIPASSTLSASRGSHFSISLGSLTDVENRWIAIGSSPTPPATFAALTASVLLRVVDGDTVTLRPSPGGGSDAQLSVTLGQSSTGSMTVGDHVYACLFTPSPTGPSVPQIVVDLGVLAA